MPTNLYGPNDNFNLETSHVIPSLINKFHSAKKNRSSEVEIGDRKTCREFLHVDDFADACIFFMEKKNSDLKKLTNNFNRTNHFFNVGSGKDISIKDLAFLMKEILAFDGNIIFNKTMPDGTPKKLLDIELMESLGWTSKIPLRQKFLILTLGIKTIMKI